MKKILILLMGGLLWTSHSKGQVILQALDAPDTQPPFHLPNGVTLGDYTHFIASIYDNDYLPYTLPTTPADWTSYDAGGGTDPLIDVQGTITTQGREILIPLQATSSGTLPAGKFTTYVPASKTQDGQARTLELSWNDTPFTNTTTHLIATLKSLAGDLNVKKLDVNRGVGNDTKGVELAVFNINTTTPSKVTLRAIAGVPDKKFGVQTTINGQTAYRHRFIYLPIQGPDGKMWLNNNLGADYANVHSTYFNPAYQAGSLNHNGSFVANPTIAQIKEDRRAKGSLFMSVRDSDGHELMDWNSGTGTHLYPHMAQQSGISLTSDDICPNGWHIPTIAEADNLRDALRKGRSPHSPEYKNPFWYDTSLRLPSVQLKLIDPYSGNIGDATDSGLCCNNNAGPNELTLYRIADMQQVDLKDNYSIYNYMMLYSSKIGWSYEGDGIYFQTTVIHDGEIQLWIPFMPVRCIAD